MHLMLATKLLLMLWTTAPGSAPRRKAAPPMPALPRPAALPGAGQEQVRLARVLVGTGQHIKLPKLSLFMMTLALSPTLAPTLTQVRRVGGPVPPLPHPYPYPSNPIALALPLALALQL